MNKQKDKLTWEINMLISEMRNYEPYTQEYSTMARNVETLMKASSYRKEPPVNLNTLLTIAGSLAEILLILNYEQVNVVTTKAMSRLIKPKL